ncbi:MAG TPA: DUF389 domain-containing protein [Anaerolineales bacterium]|nr:DUF389 domain-containing protein [Anaerolineales bacterium]
MNYTEPTTQPNPGPAEEFVSARARRRRAQRRAYFPTDQGERAALFEQLARRAFPSYELFVFSLVSGAILGLGYVFNAQALLIFGVLVAPLLTPWIGMALGIVAGAPRLFAQTFVAILISALLIFMGGWIAGFVSRNFQPLNFNEAFTHSRLWWLDLVVLAIGAILITISFVRSENRPYLPSVLLAYELFLPLSAAGLGMGSAVEGLWPQGVFVFLTHLAWATLFGLLTLFFLRFYPSSTGGILFTGLIFIMLLAVLVSLTGLANWTMQQADLITSGLFDRSQGGLATATLTIPTAGPAATVTGSPRPDLGTAIVGVPTGSLTLTPRATPSQAALPATETPTITITAEPTPILAIIRASEGGGAFIRENPGGLVLATLSNGSVVTIVPDDLQEVNGVVWVHVFTTVNDVRVEGWMIQTVLQTATPAAD